MKKTKLIASLFVLLFIFSCSPSNIVVSKITISGSDTMQKLVELLAERYMSMNPGTSIYVSGGGTATGVKEMLSGSSNICMASRNLVADEIKELADSYGSIGVSYLIAKDALSIYVNKENPVEQISTDQLKKIFICEENNWDKYSEKDLPILPVIRPPNSGTHLYFKQHILGGEDYCSSSTVINTTSEVVELIEENENAIGYGGIGYADNVKALSINGIAANEENVRSGLYPISRYLYFYLLKKPDGELEKFIEWVLSPAGQKIVSEAGYIPIWSVRA